MRVSDEVPADVPAEIEAEIINLMSGGPLGDGIGPGNTTRRINDKYGLNLDPFRVHALWQRYINVE